ncbi:MAG: CopG family transcriptional regulator [Gemmatimonadota bacterium]
MTTTAAKRATVYFDAALHRALRLKAAETDQSLSELVNAAVRRSLGEDAEDLAAFEARAKEPNLAFEAVLKDLRRRGKL